MATVSGSREVPAPRADVWRALAVLRPYCAVCDVSYVVDDGGPARGGRGTTFRCVPGRLDGRPPRAAAPRGEIVEWDPLRLVVTRLELTPETWISRIELADVAAGTRVSLTLSHQPTGGNRVVRWLQRGAHARLVQRTVDGELAKIPAHIAQLEGAPR